MASHGLAWEWKKSGGSIVKSNEKKRKDRGVKQARIYKILKEERIASKF